MRVSVCFRCGGRSNDFLVKNGLAQSGGPDVLVVVGAYVLTAGLRDPPAPASPIWNSNIIKSYCRLVAFHLPKVKSFVFDVLSE